jgi:uncharacterized membrane protein
MTTQTLSVKTPRKGLAISLWAVQALLALFFIYAGVTKLTTPLDQLSKMMPWTGAYPSLVPVAGIADLFGGIGILLPALTRIWPRLTLLAAVGLLVLQVLAMGLHLMRGELMVVPMNVVLLALVAFVLWGRTRALPVVSRS